MPLFDEDEMECEYCGHIGLMFNGDFDGECPVCGAEYSLINEDEAQLNPEMLMGRRWKYR